jgi:hypothetical protein
MPLYPLNPEYPIVPEYPLIPLPLYPLVPEYPLLPEYPLTPLSPVAPVAPVGPLGPEIVTAAVPFQDVPSQTQVLPPDIYVWPGVGLEGKSKLAIILL